VNELLHVHNPSCVLHFRLYAFALSICQMRSIAVPFKIQNSHSRRPYMLRGWHIPLLVSAEIQKKTQNSLMLSSSLSKHLRIARSSYFAAPNVTWLGDIITIFSTFKYLETSRDAANVRPSTGSQNRGQATTEFRSGSRRFISPGNSPSVCRAWSHPAEEFHHGTFSSKYTRLFAAAKAYTSFLRLMLGQRTRSIAKYDTGISVTSLWGTQAWGVWKAYRLTRNILPMRGGCSCLEMGL
jgi:hypothetical protein